MTKGPSFLLAFLLAVAFATCPARTAPAAESAPARTVIHDGIEAKMLLGDHLFAEDGLTIDGPFRDFWFGKARISKDESGTFHVIAEHNGKWHFRDSNGHGYARMDGIITEIHSGGFRFHGMVEFFVQENENTDDDKYNMFVMINGPCSREGTFDFSRRKHPVRWRLQQIYAVCKGVRGYDEQHGSRNFDEYPIDTYIDLFTKHEHFTDLHSSVYLK